MQCLKYGKLHISLLVVQSIKYDICRMEKYCLTDSSAKELLFFLLKLIKYAYSQCQAEPFGCILYEISGFTKSRETLKIISGK